MKTLKTAILISLLSVSCNSFADLNTGLVAHWSFDDCTALDITGHGHNGTLNGTPQCIDGISSKALSFNGSTDFIDVPDNAELNQKNLTLIAWIKPQTLNNQGGWDGQIIINKENQYELQLMQINEHSAKAQHLAFAVNPYWWWYDAGFKPPVNNYTQFVMTFDKNNHAKSYVNGKLTNDITFSKPLQTTSYCLRIGARGCEGINSPWALFNGVIDEVRIYNRALSASEIQSSYYAILPPIIKGSVTWANPYSVTCQNNTTGTEVVINSKSTQYDCEKSELNVNSGDDIAVTIKGKKY